MKIYVDELPKNCAECKFCERSKPPAERPEIECMHCNMAKTFNSISTFCPLQLLSEHDKKVRKKVCEEIRKKVLEYFNVKNEEEYENSLSLLDALFTADVVFEILDRVLGGEE